MMNLTKIKCRCYDIASASTGISSLLEDLTPEMNAEVITRHLQQYLAAFSNDLSLVAEFPYTDKHYRDSYYLYHSSKYQSFSRDTIRVHLFDRPVSEVKIDSLPNARSFGDDYLGYFIVRPLPDHPIGRSIISPKALVNKNFRCCLTRDTVSFLGYRFEVYGFPHTAQDTETQTCAESSLWSLLEYFGTKYPEYRPALPSEILKSLRNESGRRLLPSVGLSLLEISQTLIGMGHPCLTYVRRETKSFPSILKIYIESGIPVIASLTNKSSGHAVLVIGHADGKVVPNKIFSSRFTIVNAEDLDGSLVFIDDNRPPYQVAELEAPTAHYSTQSLQDLRVDQFVVPLQRHMNLDALGAIRIRDLVLKDVDVGLEALGAKGIWIARLFLTSSKSFKEKMLDDDELAIEYKAFLSWVALPKFIWVCEICRRESYESGRSDGLLLLDATGDATLNSVICYFLVDHRAELDRGQWTAIEKVAVFRAKLYENNLKGEWSGWMTRPDSKTNRPLP